MTLQFMYYFIHKNILTQKIQCFCTHQAEAASQQNYHISEHLRKGKTKEKQKEITMHCLYSFQVQVGAQYIEYITQNSQLVQGEGQKYKLQAELWPLKDCSWQTENEKQHKQQNVARLWGWFSVHPTWGWDSGADSCSLFIVLYTELSALRPSAALPGAHTSVSSLCKWNTRVPTSEQPLQPLPCAQANRRRNSNQIDLFHHQETPAFKKTTSSDTPSENTTPTPHPNHFWGWFHQVAPAQHSTAHQSWFVPCWASCPCPGIHSHTSGTSPGTGTQPVAPPGSVTPSPQHRQIVKDARLLKMGV